MQPLDAKHSDKVEIDRLIKDFFSVFCNQGGARPCLERIHGMFIKEGLIIKNAGAVPEINNLQQFISPRERILTDGTLREFTEEEVSDRTDICGNIAQRISFYRKSGILSGQPFQGRGVKTSQLIRTAEGWKLSSLAWDDEREGFALPGDLDACSCEAKPDPDPPVKV
jgi:hypothetical protein